MRLFKQSRISIAQNRNFLYSISTMIEIKFNPCHRLLWIWVVRYKYKINASRRHYSNQGASISRSHHPHLINRKKQRNQRHHPYCMKVWAKLFSPCSGKERGWIYRCKSRKQKSTNLMEIWVDSCWYLMIFAVTLQLCGTSTKNKSLRPQWMVIKFPESEG